MRLSRAIATTGSRTSSPRIRGTFLCTSDTGSRSSARFRWGRRRPSFPCSANHGDPVPMKPIDLHPDRLFPADPSTRALARALYATVEHLPIVSPHGHTDPQWFADDAPFPNASALFITPDHYVFRMLYSQGVRARGPGHSAQAGRERPARGRDRRRARSGARSPRTITCSVARRRGSGSTTRSARSSAWKSGSPPRAPIATSTGSTRRLPRPRSVRARCSSASTSRRSPRPSRRSIRSVHHRKIRDSGWHGRVITAYRPDPVVDPEFEGFADNVAQFGVLTGEDTTHVERVPRRASQSSCVLQVDGRDLDRPRPSDRADERPRRARVPAAARSRAGRHDHGGRGRSVPRPGADRDGDDERRRRARHADPSGQLPQPQRGRCSATTAATRAPTSRRRPTTCARCGRCSTSSATRAA